MHNRLAEIRRSLSGKNDSVVGLDAYIAVVKPGHTKDVESNQGFEDGTKTGVTKDQ